MAILSPQLSEYLDNLLGPRPAEMQKMEAYAEEHGFPIIGPACGQLCYQIARLAGATRIYELGSGYGYSTAWFARAVKENGGGEVHHVVWDEDLSRMARGHLAALGYDDTVRYTIGEAVDALGNVDGKFDLIFMDIDKEGYPGALPLIYEKLKPGGLLIVDNVLWSGRIFDDKDQSGATQAIRELTGMLASDDAWVSSIIPIRDGLMVASKQA
jgi:predicted O-methyltransferase YrrM